jgi:hypothetical protein
MIDSGSAVGIAYDLAGLSDGVDSVRYTPVRGAAAEDRFVLTSGPTRRVADRIPA